MSEYTKQLCVDVILKGTKYEGLYDKYLLDFLTKSGGKIETDKITRLSSKEQEKFSLIAFEFIKGKIMAVDQLLPDGINISINVNNEVAHEVHMNRVRFRVKAEIDI